MYLSKSSSDAARTGRQLMANLKLSWNTKGISALTGGPPVHPAAADDFEIWLRRQMTRAWTGRHQVHPEADGDFISQTNLCHRFIIKYSLLVYV